MPNAATLMTPKAKDLLQKQERSASVVGFEEAVVILSDEIQVTRVFVSVENPSPPSVFSVGTLPRFFRGSSAVLPRFAMSAD